MLSFYPGPSKLYNDVPTYFLQAYEEGYLSINHRSREFVELSKSCILLLKQKLNIPASYSCFYASSATECWEIIALSLINHKSVHYFNGAFGKKWWEYTQKLVADAVPVAFDLEDELLPEQPIPDAELVCITQNETSNGTAVANGQIKRIKEMYPHALIAVDATSSMGGIELEFKNADVWFASVQKCFGLPSGLALMVCSPQAIDKAIELNKRSYYNSLTFMVEMMENWQTTYTPNVLNIFLLKKVLEKIPVIDLIHEKLLQRYKDYYSLIKELDWTKPLVKNEKVRSETVIVLELKQTIAEKVKVELKKQGVVIGNGYGIWAQNTLRIANFPALEDEEIQFLKNLLRKIN